MNIQRVIFLCLWVLLLLPSKVFSSDHCAELNNEMMCIQVSVQSMTEKALENMVVYLEPLDGQILDTSTKKVIIDQVDKSFSPYISVSQVNTSVVFANQDDITHHIYSAGSENKFSFKIRAGQTNTSTQFKHASEVAMGCNIHDWMSGHLLVVNTPYFGKTDKKGMVNFAIEKQGRYKIVLWHPQLQEIDNRMIKEAVISSNAIFSFILKRKMPEIPIQKSEDDFDFLSDYE